MRQQLTKLKINIKLAAGFNDFPAKILKEAGHTVSKPITYLLNFTISTGEIPADWKTAKIARIFHSGRKEAEDIAQFRSCQLSLI